MASSLARWLPLVGLLLFAALSLALLQPPRPMPATASAAEFSAYRALPDVAQLARQPHPLGSAAQAQVRDYLLGRLRALGLAPMLIDTTALAAGGGGVAVGRVQNIVARLPGRQPGDQAVLVLAHYDSQPQAPGAGDDGAAVAAMLEAIRALRAGPPLTHDVIWLFTDGEEAGLLGARAYAADTARLRREVGVALNFEGRGNQGPSLTFEVSAGNGWLLRQYAQAAPAPLASSLFYEAYRYLPNDTDFTALRQAGVAGLNFAFVGGFAYYHSAADTPAHLDLGSLQHHGSYLLSLVRQFGNADLTQTRAPDYTFFNPLGTWLVTYPAAWNLPLSLGAGALLLLVAATAVHRRQLSWSGLLGGAIIWAGGLLLMLAVGWGLLALVSRAYPAYAAFYGHAPYNALSYQVALLALGLGVFSAYYTWLSNYLRPNALTGGALLAVAGLLGVLQTWAPSAAFLLVWPLLAATLAWALRLRRVAAPAQLPPPGLAGWLLALPAVALLNPVIYLLLVIFALDKLVLAGVLLLAVLLGLLVPVLLPVLAATGPQPARRSWALPGLALAGALLALAIGHITRQPTSDQPQQTHLYYALDADQGQAWWLSVASRPDAWTRQVLTQPQYQALPALFPGSPAPVLHQAALVAALPPCTIRVLADSQVAGHRYLRLGLYPGRPGVGSLRLALAAAAPVQSLRLAGQLVPPDLAAKALPQGSLTLFAPRPAGEVVELELASLAPVRLTVVTRSQGLPTGLGLPTLPATVVPAPGYNSFTTQVWRTVEL